jgi:serine/threonine protein kinase
LAKFLAITASSNRSVPAAWEWCFALKTLPTLPLLSDAARRQFRREALSLGKITDPNVAIAFDFGRDSGIDYLVTEYVPGLTIEAKLAGRPLPEQEILRLGEQLSEGTALPSNVHSG